MFYHIKMNSRRAVVLGRSDIVGKPMALMLLRENATVTICHSGTSNLIEECRRADFLVAAMGKPAYLTSEYIAPGATVIDVGTNRLTDHEEAVRASEKPWSSIEKRMGAGRRCKSRSTQPTGPPPTPRPRRRRAC